MDKLEIALKLIANCDFCNGKGYSYWGGSDDEYGMTETETIEPSEEEMQAASEEDAF